MPPHPGSFWDVIFVCLQEAIRWSERERVYNCPLIAPCERIEEEIELPVCPQPLPQEFVYVVEPVVVPQIPPEAREEGPREEAWSRVFNLLGWALAGGQAFSIAAWRVLFFLRGCRDVPSQGAGAGSWTRDETSHGDESFGSWGPRAGGLSRRRPVA